MSNTADYYEDMAAPYGSGLSPRSKRIVRMRLELPYGVWTCADGTEVLYNRDYEPICRRTPYGQVEPFHRSEFIPWKDQKWFYYDGNPPWENRATHMRCKKALDDFKRGKPLVGMLPRGEWRRRIGR